MELLVATWTVRLALVAALLVGGISLSAGATLVDAVLRAAVAAFVFTLGGRLLIGFLETPDQRMRRLRAARTKRLGKGGDKAAGKPPKAEKPPKPPKAAKAAASPAAAGEDAA